ncbi:hypothetical protein NMG60_11009300 [Bertholletia excelsa]
MASTPPNDSDPPTDPDQQQQPPSSSELLASAKTVAEAAQFTLRNEGEKVDKTRVAGAAEDLLGAASHYGKLEEKGMSQYVEKAESYLQQYGSSDSSTTTGGGEATATTPSKSGGESGEQGQSGGGYGDYLNMAKRFLNN